MGLWHLVRPTICQIRNRIPERWLPWNPQVRLLVRGLHILVINLIRRHLVLLHLVLEVWVGIPEARPTRLVVSRSHFLLVEELR